jgi:hypothetical protein
MRVSDAALLRYGDVDVPTIESRDGRAGQYW